MLGRVVDTFAGFEEAYNLFDGLGQSSIDTNSLWEGESNKEMLCLTSFGDN